jgi:hypothetical protein
VRRHRGPRGGVEGSATRRCAGPSLLPRAARLRSQHPIHVVGCDARSESASSSVKNSTSERTCSLVRDRQQNERQSERVTVGRNSGLAPSWDRSRPVQNRWRSAGRFACCASRSHRPPRLAAAHRSPGSLRSATRRCCRHRRRWRPLPSRSPTAPTRPPTDTRPPPPQFFERSAAWVKSVVSRASNASAPLTRASTAPSSTLAVEPPASARSRRDPHPGT